MSNFGRSLRKTVELKNLSVPNDKAPSQTQLRKILLHQPVNSHCTLARRPHIRKLHSPSSALETILESGELPPSNTWQRTRERPGSGFLSTFMKMEQHLWGWDFGQTEAIIRYISNGRMEILRLAAIKPLASRQAKFQNCGTWKGAGFLFCLCFGQQRF